MESQELMPQHGAILKELSDIKASLAVNTSETNNIKSSINEIKIDIKEIKALYITHDEFKTVTKTDEDHESRLRSLEGKVWKAIGALSIAQVIILPVVLYLFFKTVK